MLDDFGKDLRVLSGFRKGHRFYEVHEQPWLKNLMGSVLRRFLRWDNVLRLPIRPI